MDLSRSIIPHRGLPARVKGIKKPAFSGRVLVSYSPLRSKEIRVLVEAASADKWFSEVRRGSMPIDLFDIFVQDCSRATPSYQDGLGD